MNGNTRERSPTIVTCATSAVGSKVTLQGISLCIALIRGKEQIIIIEQMIIIMCVVNIFLPHQNCACSYVHAYICILNVFVSVCT